MEKGKVSKIIDEIIFFAMAVTLFFIFINYDLVPKNQPAPAPGASQQTQKITQDEPEIIGPPEFQTEVKEAISLMKEKAPNHCHYLCSLVERIELTSDDPPTEKTFAWTDSKEPVIYFNSKRYQEHLKYRNDASIRGGKYIIPILLAHETAHRIQFEYYQVTDARELESQALAAERDLLKKLGLSQETVNQFSGEHLLKEKWWD